MEVEWVYRRDDFDLTLSKAAELLPCADYLETLLLQQACCGDWFGYLPAQEILGHCPERLTEAIRVLSVSAHRDGQVVQRVDDDYLRLLARIGTPVLFEFWDPSGKHEVEFWPQADWPATRRDLLHFYLLVKAEYVHLKATLQAQAVENEALRQLTDFAGRLLDTEISPPAVIGEFKNEIIRSWHQVKWSPPEEGPPATAKHPARGRKLGRWLLTLTHRLRRIAWRTSRQRPKNTRSNDGS